MNLDFRGRISNVLRRHGRGVIGLPVTVFIVGVAIAAPFLAPHSPTEQEKANRLLPPQWADTGSHDHILGTDQLGRDLLSRIIYGARVSLTVAVTAAAISCGLGTILGLLSGYYRGFLDQIIQRLTEVQLAFPFFLMAITIMSIFRPSMRNVILVLCVYGWVVYCRIIRARVLSLREEGFVQAAFAIGCSSWWVIRRHLLPNVAPLIIVLGTLQLAEFILAEAALSFLGMGIQPPTPSWGGMINDGREYIWVAWWIQTFPGVAIVLSVSGLGLVGDWLRDLLDPTLRH